MMGPSMRTAPATAAQPRRAADWGALGVVCPLCQGALVDAGVSALACTRCGATWPVTCGIPDLRTIGDPYLGLAEDAAAATALASREDALSFAALYAAYYEGNDKVTHDQVVRFTHGVLAAADRATATLETWRELGAAIDRAGTVLEVGCGTAPLGVVMAAAGHRVLAIDAGLRWLVLARKRAAERGIDLPVLCANAERLPLRDGGFAATVGESVLENFTDPEAGIAEMRRVTRAGGPVALTTPNRHSLGPDPHLGLLAGGWRSLGALRRHAQRTGQVMPRRRLFSPHELVDALREGGLETIRIALPRFADAQRAGQPPHIDLAIAAYHLARRLPGVRGVVLQVAPTLAVVARSTARST